MTKETYKEYEIVASKAVLKCNACGTEKIDVGNGHKEVGDPVRSMCATCGKIVGHKVKGIILTVKDLGKVDFSEEKPTVELAPPISVGEVDNKKIKPE